MKKQYETPSVDKINFNYRDQVVAASGDIPGEVPGGVSGGNNGGNGDSGVLGAIGGFISGIADAFGRNCSGWVDSWG